MTTTETEVPEAPEEPLALESGEKPSFWHRPNVDRYLSPIVIPIAIVIGLAMFTINISRIFLAGGGESPVIIGSLITGGILVGAAFLSASPTLKSSALACVAVGFVGTIIMFGWLSLGSAEPHEENIALPPDVAVLGDFSFEATGALTFVPNRAESGTGIYQIMATSTGGTHTLVFDDPNAVVFEGLSMAGTGQSDAKPVFFGEPGEFGFHCTVPGHESMVGTFVVDGEPITFEAALAQAEAEGGAPAEGGEGGETPAEGGEETPTES